MVTFDEVGFRLVPTYHRVWAPKNSRPKGIFFWSNKKTNMIGALIDGKKLHYEWNDSLNTVTFYFFLERFLKKHPRKKYLFIMDNVGYHKTSPIKELLEKHAHRIKIEYLPTYSPELNPTETCWKIIRNNVTNSTYYTTLQKLKSEIDKFNQKQFFKLNVLNYLCP
ncbi:MAG: IS630 family transposase [Nanoarchaeota archaeon]|nr:IS630 family transposase [Nanoarchaeota archaeon]